MKWKLVMHRKCETVSEVSNRMTEIVISNASDVLLEEMPFLSRDSKEWCLEYSKENGREL
jgi:hypothetical protein